jgi:glycosyltransferase involved in cell wall biosynthesis
MLIENLSFPMDRRMRQEASALHEAGYEVSVICPKGEAHDRAGFGVVEGIRVHRYPLWQATTGSGYVLEYSWAMVCTFFLLLQIFATRGFDYIHAANPPDLFFLLYLPFSLLGKKFVYDQHDLCPETYESKFNRRDWVYRVLLKLEQYSYRCASLVIATNQSFYDLARRRGDVPPGNLTIVRSGPDLKHFQRVEAQPHLKKGFKYMVAYLGVMSVQDGVDRVIAAASHLQRIRGARDVLFILIGKGDQWNRLRRQAQELGLDESIEFTGRIPDAELLLYLSTADICIAPDPPIPLNHMSTMNKIMEYMACAKPIVSFDLIESRRSAREAAVYVEGDDTELMAQAINRLLDDPCRREEMGNYGFGRVCGDLDWRYSAHNLVTAYNRLEPIAAMSQVTD